MALPIVSANLYLKTIMQERAQQALHALTSASGVIERVKACIRRDITERPLSMERIGSELGISRQTLYRRLKEEQTTFSALCDQVRQEQAEYLLGHGAVTVDQLSNLLGFQDISACNKAFRRWFGLSPSDYRKTKESS